MEYHSEREKGEFLQINLEKKKKDKRTWERNHLYQTMLYYSLKNKYMYDIYILQTKFLNFRKEKRNVEEIIRLGFIKKNLSYWEKSLVKLTGNLRAFSNTWVIAMEK